MLLTCVTFLIFGTYLFNTFSTTEAFVKPIRSSDALFLIDCFINAEFTPEFVESRVFSSVLTDSAMPSSAIRWTFWTQKCLNIILVKYFPRFPRFQ